MADQEPIQRIDPEKLKEITKNIPETERLREQRLEFEASEERMRKLDEAIENHPMRPLRETEETK